MTADHGEGLGEHSEVTHAVLAYNSTLHVPLIIRPPASAAPAGMVVEPRVGTVDIVPTVLDLLGVPAPEGLRRRPVPLLWRAELTDTHNLVLQLFVTHEPVLERLATAPQAAADLGYA